MKNVKLFGTDGIRAPNDSEILNEANIKKIGEILGFLYNPKKVFIAQDTRESGPKIANSLILGLKTFGAICDFEKVLPTGAVSFITQKFNYDLGIMISASHNPYTDNGIKIFNKHGYKISREEEQKIEKLYFLNNYYLTYIKNNFNIFSDKLNNYKIIIDCAHGSACDTIFKLFSQYNNIKIINNKPTGYNINLNAGSENLDVIKEEVLKNKADLGIAFDGDADRVVFIDENGEKVEGDAILALMAIDLKQKNKLKNNKIAATIMSGPGLDLALKPYSIFVHKTDVGDKNVSDFLAKNKLNFGGENSGHIVLHDHCHSGDGIFAACYFLEIFLGQNKTVSNLFNFYQKIPNTLKNIIIHKKIPLKNLPKTNNAINKANEELNGHGRVLFRYSGTEMKARLLVEALTQKDCEKIANNIIAIFEDEQKEI